jgi:hypothetical protein
LFVPKGLAVLFVALLLVSVSFTAYLLMDGGDRDEGAKSAPGPLLVGIEKMKDPSRVGHNVGRLQDEGLYTFVLNPSSGEVWGIRDRCYRGISTPEPSHAYACMIRLVTWLDNDTLRVETNEPPGGYYTREVADNAVYHVELSGEVRRTAEPPLRLHNPYATMRLGETDLGRPWSNIGSPDGRWRFGIEGDRFDLSRVRVNNGIEPDFEFESVAQGSVRWSPTESKLAFVGNFCTRTGFDLFVFDAPNGKPNNLTENVDGSVLFYEWNPTGKSLVATVLNFRNMEENAKLMLFSPDGREPPRTLLEWPWSIGLIPAGWNPEGSLLLLQFHGGGDWCTSTVGEIPPTSLRRSIMTTPVR